MHNGFDVLSFVHTPAQAGNALLSYAEHIQNYPGCTWGIPAIDKRVIPERPGEVVGIIGRPGDGKTAIMAYRARHEAMEIAADPKREGEIVIYVAWEGTIESLEPYWLADPGINASDIAWGRADLDSLRHRVIKTRARLPVWVIGYSGEQRKKWGKDIYKVPQLSPEVVFECIERMRDAWPEQVKSIRLMVFDYIQRAPSDKRYTSRFERVGENAYAIEDLAIRIGCPALLGIQASRSVDSYDVKLAGMDDCQDSSKIEQSVSKLFSLWRPWRTEAAKYSAQAMFTRDDGIKELPQAEFKANGRYYTLNETLLLIKMLKQRGDSGSYSWVLNFHPAYLRLMEINH